MSVSMRRASGRPQGPLTILVGRTEEQAALREQLAMAVAGHGQLCFLGGEAGIGKTSLARDLTRTAHELGVRVLTGTCYDLGNPPPYGLWLDLFASSEGDPSAPTPPAAFMCGRLAPVSDQAALHADVRRFLVELAGDRPVLLILEDLHWGDPASLDLLRHIGPQVRHLPLLVVVTYRNDEIAPGSPFALHFPALVREADGYRVGLQPLDRDALRTLVASQHTLPRADEDRLLTYLERHAEGNPFFAVEILRTLEMEGLLRDEGSALGRLDRVVVPTLLRHVIDGRVSRLGEQTRQALAIASVIGQEVPLPLWAAVTGLSDEVLLDGVEEAVDAHLLDAEREGTRVHFVHALTREALYEGVLPPRRRIWHRKIAEVLLAAQQPDPEAVAFHLQAAGDARAADWLVAAGERAQWAYAWLTAAERFRAAANLMEGVEDREHVRAQLLIRVGNMLRFADLDSAITATEEAQRLSRQAGDTMMEIDTEIQFGILHGYADQFRVGLVKLERGISAIEAMPTSMQPSPRRILAWISQAITWRDQDLEGEEAALNRLSAAGVDYRRYRRSMFCNFLASAGHLANATTITQPLASILDTDAGTARVIRLVAAFARHGLAIAAVAKGDPEAARELWARARLEFGDHHVLVAFTLLDELRDVALTYRADEPGRRRWCASEGEAALGRAGGALRPGVSPKLAWLRCLVMDGRWDEATQLLDDLPPPGNCFLRRETTFARAYLARHRGEPDVAWAEIRPLFPQGSDTEPGDIIHQEGLFLQRLAAGLCLDAGDLPGASAWLSAHDRWLDWSGSVLGQAEVQLAWGHYHHAAGDIDRARNSLAQALKLATELEQPLVLLGAQRLLGEIDTGAGRYADAESHLSAALGLADACEVPYERALTLLALAELRAATRATDDAASLAEEAAQVLDVLGAAPSLVRGRALRTRLSGRAWTPASSFGLTGRELEVLRLVAEGRTNPEIAEALFISRRTAATHVSNIFRKLDAGSRAEAVDLAHRHDLLSSRT